MEWFLTDAKFKYRYPNIQQIILRHQTRLRNEKQIELFKQNRIETTLKDQTYQKEKKSREILNEISADCKIVWAIHDIFQMATATVQ